MIPFYILALLSIIGYAIAKAYDEPTIAVLFVSSAVLHICLLLIVIVVKTIRAERYRR